MKDYGNGRDRERKREREAEGRETDGQAVRDEEREAEEPQLSEAISLSLCQLVTEAWGRVKFLDECGVELP